MKLTLKNHPVITGLIIGIITFLLGWNTKGLFSGSEGHAGNVSITTEEKSAEVWTCSMHPQFKLPEAGQCPICFMDLIPLEVESKGDGPSQLSMSESAMKLAEVETVLVRRDTATALVHLSGKVEYDETLIGTITAWFPGRLERLFVDYTGIYVNKGDHMVDLYSPELYTAQEELIQSSQRLKSISDKQSSAFRTAESILAAAREKFRLLGLTDEQVRNIEQQTDPTDKLTIYSPLSGVVIHKNAREGMYVNTGTAIYTIADLKQVWIILDAYESDISLLKHGQEVTLTVEALPGQTFTGNIAFIDPVMDDRTRTVKIRLNISNENGALKPGMFIRASVKAVLDSNGDAVNPGMVGKWVCPMHPEVVEDESGDCRICGMPLITAEDMGIVSLSNSGQLPLLIPVTAVLRTGKRSVVYIYKPSDDGPRFEGREISIGSRAGDNYIVLSGLDEGESVVSRGNFKIDSAMQIAAKPSMMNPAGGISTTGHEHHGKGTNTSQNSSDKKLTTMDVAIDISSDLLNKVVDEYLILQDMLAKDEYQHAYEALMGIHNMTMGVKGAEALMNPSIKPAGDIEKLRQVFEEISIVLRHAAAYGKVSIGLNEAYCPMAFDFRGAYWLQKDEKINNPYFGSQMLRCGEIKNRWSGDNATPGENHDHE